VVEQFSLTSKRSCRFLSAAVLMSVLVGAGCSSLSPVEKHQYENLICQGAEPVVDKKPGVAAALNVLPGIGDLYTKQYGAFALDFLFWWPSVIWAVPQGAVTAGNLNKKATIAYYTLGAGKGQFDANEPCRDSSHGHAHAVVASVP